MPLPRNVEAKKILIFVLFCFLLQPFLSDLIATLLGLAFLLLKKYVSGSPLFKASFLSGPSWNRSQSHKSTYDLVKVKYWSCMRSDKLDKIGV